MMLNEPLLSDSNNGEEEWRARVSEHGIDEAIRFVRKCFEFNLLREQTDDDKRYCRELFAAMHNDTVNRVEPNKLVYAYGMKIADDRSESSYYYASRELNIECAQGIVSFINKSCYRTNYYNLEMAAMSAIVEYGFPRVCLVLAFNYQNKKRDGRLTYENRRWLDSFKVNDEAFNNSWLRAHAILIDGFCGYVRALYQSMGAEQLLYPGSETRNEFTHGYVIKRAITISKDGAGALIGYAVGHNPNAVSPWVCWRYSENDGERDYYWGIYSYDEQGARDAYNSRIFIAFNR